MLELILDKEFANKFLHAYSGNDEYVDDFLKYFIRNLQKLKLISNYLDIEDFMNQAKDNAFLELIIESNPELIFRADLLTQIDSPEFPVTGSPFKLVLTGEDIETCTRRRKRFGLEFFNLANLSDRWHLYYSHRRDIYKKTTDDTEIPDDFRFDSWNKFKPFNHPLNAVIIVDFYLLYWDKEEELKSNLENNIIPLIENLLSQSASEIQTEITFISEFKDRPPRKQEERVKRSLYLIEDAIKKITTHDFKLNIIVHHRRNIPSDFQAFHDRIIITNYFYINCGAGFSIQARKAGVNIFDKLGNIFKIRHNTEIQFRSIFNIQNFWTAFKDLKQLDIYCKRLENHPGLPDYVNYCPTKLNRLLNIKHS